MACILQEKLLIVMHIRVDLIFRLHGARDILQVKMQLTYKLIDLNRKEDYYADCSST